MGSRRMSCSMKTTERIRTACSCANHSSRREEARSGRLRRSSGRPRPPATARGQGRQRLHIPWRCIRQSYRIDAGWDQRPFSIPPNIRWGLSLMPESIEAVLDKYWGFDTFHPRKKQAMECGCCGRDSIVVLPTEGGKSLCFQAPALVLPQLTLAVSPLISLMKGQIDSLLDSGVPAGCLDSTISHPERNAIFDRPRARRFESQPSLTTKLHWCR